MLAIIGLQVRLLIAAWTPAVHTLLLGLINHGGRDDTRRHRNDGVAEYHDEAGQQPADGGDRSDVAITHGGEGDDCPVDAGGDRGELRAWLPTLHHEHDGAENGDQNEHEQEVNGYLAEASLDAFQEEKPLVDEREQPEHSENADEPECSQNEEVSSTGQARNERQIERQDCQQIDDAEEVQYCCLTVGGRVDSQDILDGEEESQHILQHRECRLEVSNHGRFTLDEGDHETHHDGNHHGDVERFARRRVVICHDTVQPWLIFQ